MPFAMAANAPAVADRTTNPPRMRPARALSYLPAQPTTHHQQVPPTHMMLRCQLGVGRVGLEAAGMQVVPPFLQCLASSNASLPPMPPLR